jgi:hypothetical protein
MSFDIDFDFTDEIREYTDLRAACQTTLDDVNAQISLMNTCVGYDEIKNEELTRLILIQTRNSDLVAGYAATLSDINSLQNLNGSDKTILYTFWGFSGKSKESYMCLMISNYTAMLSDNDILTIVVDDKNTVEIKNEIGRLIISKYSIGEFC